MATNTKEFQKYILNYSIEQIKEAFNLKTKKEAEQWFWEAVSYNLVQEEIINQIEYLMEEGAEE